MQLKPGFMQVHALKIAPAVLQIHGRLVVPACAGLLLHVCMCVHALSTQEVSDALAGVESHADLNGTLQPCTNYLAEHSAH